MSATPAVECRGLVHIYRAADLEVVTLQGLDMTVGTGELVAVVGASGSGKTTLMNVLAAVQRPSAGQATVGGRDLGALDERARDRYRREVVGYVWQEASLNLVPQLSAEENVQLPLLASHRPWADRRARAAELLRAFGLSHARRRRPAALSGGEQQLLALATALANWPRVLLADEPTAELNGDSAAHVLQHLRDQRRREGTTVLMVTHDRAAGRYVDRVLRIRDGRTSTEARAETGELVILDRTGRLQLPRHLIDEAGLGDLVRVRREESRLVVEPALEERPEDG